MTAATPSRVVRSAQTPSIFSFDAALVNGGVDADTNSSKSFIGRAGIKTDWLVFGASVKVGDGVGSEIQKEWNNVLGLDTLHTLNLFLSRDVGHDATKQTGFQYAWQSLVLTHPLISPGVEFYGIIPDIAHAGPTSSQQFCHATTPSARE